MGRWRPDEDDALEVIPPEGEPLPSAVVAELEARSPSTSRSVVFVLGVAMLVVGLALAGATGRRLRDAADDRDGRRALAGAPWLAPPPTTTPLAAATPSGPPLDPTGRPPYTALEPVTQRTTAGNVGVRTFRPLGLIETCGGGDWCPPPECRPELALVVHLDEPRGDEVTVVEVVARPARSAAPFYVASWSTWPRSEDATGVWAGVAVPDGVATVDLLIKGRIVDTAPVVDGWAVVAARYANSEFVGQDDATVEARDAAGVIVDEAVVARPAPSLNRTPPGECERPAAPLPRAGASQPQDPTAAREAVVAAYHRLFDHGSSREARLASVDVTAGLDAPMDKVARDFPQAVATSTVTVSDLVFTSPTTAVVHYRLDYEGGASLGNRIGDAVFVDGAWKVRRDTYCQVLAGAGASCPPVSLDDPSAVGNG
jgi:hypothetical protein